MAGRRSGDPHRRTRPRPASGAGVCTIAGFDDDPAMEAPRQSSQETHGLQCGYGTPAMMITARDLITRLSWLDERRPRGGLGGAARGEFVARKCVRFAMEELSQ